MTVNRRADELRRRAKKDLRDQFRVESVLACGPDSVVLLATDVARGIPVALKVVEMPTPSPGVPVVDLLARFETMAGGVSSLRHSHLVPIFDFGSSDTYFWYSMQREEGPTLEVVLSGSGRLELSRTLGIIEQTASALDFLNRRGFAHGALKPSQIFLADGNWVRVADHTLSRIVRPLRPEDGKRRLEYQAPGDVHPTTGTAAADQYALAMTAYRCLFGPLESGAASSSQTDDEAEGPRDRLRFSFLEARGGDFPDHVVDALQRALSESPQRRFASVLDFATLLRGGSWVLSNPKDRRSRAGSVETPRAFVPGEGSHPAELVKRALDSGTDEAARSILPAARDGGMLARMIHARPIAQTISIGGVAAILVLAGVAFLSRGSGASPEPISLPRSTPPAVVEETAEQNGATPQTEETAVDPTPESGAGTASNPEGLRAAEPPPSRQADATEQSRVDPGSSPALTGDEPTPEEDSPFEPGQLFVNSVPWGRLYIDGTLIGNTPRANLSIDPGPHIIQILRDGYEPFELQIEVLAGDTIRLTDIELTPIRS